MKPNFILNAAALCGTLFCYTPLQAQMVGTDVFLKGKYVEIGIGHLGYYGSDANAPSGYHPHATFAGGAGHLGFVADPGMTGWSTSSGAHYMGDYFVPGTPFEGWTVEIGGNRCQGYNMGTGSSSTLTTTSGTASGSNVSYTTSGPRVIGTWQGTYDSVDITQITTLDTNQMYFTVKVIFTNTAVAPKSDIYYFRSLDPDNDQTWTGGGFPTTNLVEYQITDTTIVSATGATGAGSYLALGTTDTAATAIVYNAWPIAITNALSAGYAGTTTFGSTSFYSTGVTHPGDIAIGLMMYIPHLATVDSAGDSVYRTTATYALHPANQATINYFYAFSAAARDSAIAYLNSTTIPAGTLAIKNVNNEDNIKVYPNPSHDMVNITNLTATDRICVYDLMGKDMAQNWHGTHDGTNTFRYNDLPTGAYVVIVSDALGNIKARMPIRKM